MAKQDRVQVRVLTAIQVDGVDYSGNQVVAFPAELAKQLKAAGSADDSKEAVAYCLGTLGAEAVVHGTDEEQA